MTFSLAYEEVGACATTSSECVFQRIKCSSKTQLSMSLLPHSSTKRRKKRRELAKYQMVRMKSPQETNSQVKVLFLVSEPGAWLVQ